MEDLANELKEFVKYVKEKEEKEDEEESEAPSLFRYIDFKNAEGKDKHDVEIEQLNALKNLIKTKNFDEALVWVEEKIKYHTLVKTYGYQKVKIGQELVAADISTEEAEFYGGIQVPEKKKLFKKKNYQKYQ